MEIGDDAVEKYWSHAKIHNCPWKDISPGYHCPLGLYGDGAKYAPTGEKIIAFFLNIVLWAPKSSRMSRWLLFSVENDQSLGPATLNPLLAPIVQSLCKCFNGLPILGRKMHFAVSELRGDWEWMVALFDLRQSWRTSTFCWRSGVSKRPGDDLSFWDVSDVPEWERTQLSHLEFLAQMILPATARPLDRNIYCYFCLFGKFTC